MGRTGESELVERGTISKEEGGRGADDGGGLARLWMYWVSVVSGREAGWGERSGSGVGEGEELEREDDRRWERWEIVSGWRALGGRIKCRDLRRNLWEEEVLEWRMDREVEGVVAWRVGTGMRRGGMRLDVSLGEMSSIGGGTETWIGAVSKSMNGEMESGEGEGVGELKGGIGGCEVGVGRDRWGGESERLGLRKRGGLVGGDGGGAGEGQVEGKSGGVNGERRLGVDGVTEGLGGKGLKAVWWKCGLGKEMGVRKSGLDGAWRAWWSRVDRVIGVDDRLEESGSFRKEGWEEVLEGEHGGVHVVRRGEKVDGEEREEKGVEGERGSEGSGGKGVLKREDGGFEGASVGVGGGGGMREEGGSGLGTGNEVGILREGRDVDWGGGDEKAEWMRVLNRLVGTEGKRKKGGRRRGGEVAMRGLGDGGIGESREGKSGDAERGIGALQLAGVDLGRDERGWRGNRERCRISWEGRNVGLSVNCELNGKKKKGVVEEGKWDDGKGGVRLMDGKYLYFDLGAEAKWDGCVGVISFGKESGWGAGSGVKGGPEEEWGVDGTAGRGVRVWRWRGKSAGNGGVLVFRKEKLREWAERGVEDGMRGRRSKKGRDDGFRRAMQEVLGDWECGRVRVGGRGVGGLGRRDAGEKRKMSRGEGRVWGCVVDERRLERGECERRKRRVEKCERGEGERWCGRLEMGNKWVEERGGEEGGEGEVSDWILDEGRLRRIIKVCGDWGGTGGRQSTEVLLKFGESSVGRGIAEMFCREWGNVDERWVNGDRWVKRGGCDDWKRLRKGWESTKEEGVCRGKGELSGGDDVDNKRRCEGGRRREEEVGGLGWGRLENDDGGGGGIKDLIENNLKPCIAATIIEDRDAFRSKVLDLVSQEFNAQAPQLIEELFKNYVQSNIIQVHPTTTTSTETTSSADLQQQLYFKMKRKDNAPPEGEKRVKRHKASKSSNSARGSSSKHSSKDSTTYVSKQQQQQEWDKWVEETVIDEDEVIPKDETPKLITELQDVDKRVLTIFDYARMKATLNDALSISSRMQKKVVRITTDQPHGLDFMEQILVMRENDKSDSFSKADFKYLNKNDIEDLYYLCRNKNVNYRKTGLMNSLITFIRSLVIWERVHDF
ncbi:hypothetical protein Tco_1326327 [Tanacetum coccineum]